VAIRGGTFGDRTRAGKPELRGWQFAAVRLGTELGLESPSYMGGQVAAVLLVTELGLESPSYMGVASRGGTFGDRTRAGKPELHGGGKSRRYGWGQISGWKARATWGWQVAAVRLETDLGLESPSYMGVASRGGRFGDRTRAGKPELHGGWQVAAVLLVTELGLESPSCIEAGGRQAGGAGGRRGSRRSAPLSVFCAAVLTRFANPVRIGPVYNGLAGQRERKDS